MATPGQEAQRLPIRRVPTRPPSVTRGDVPGAGELGLLKRDTRGRFVKRGPSIEVEGKPAQQAQDFVVGDIETDPVFRRAQGVRDTPTAEQREDTERREAEEKGRPLLRRPPRRTDDADDALIKAWTLCRRRQFGRNQW